MILDAAMINWNGPAHAAHLKRHSTQRFVGIPFDFSHHIIILTHKSVT